MGRAAGFAAVPVNVSLSMLDNTHARWVAILRSMGPAEVRAGLQHPVHNRRFTLDQALDSMPGTGGTTWHISRRCGRAKAGVAVPRPGPYRVPNPRISGSNERVGRRSADRIHPAGRWRIGAHGPVEAGTATHAAGRRRDGSESLLRHAARVAVEAALRPASWCWARTPMILSPHIADLAVHSITHSGWQRGIGSSIKAGVECVTALAPAIDGVIIVVLRPAPPVDGRAERPRPGVSRIERRDRRFRIRRDDWGARVVRSLGVRRVACIGGS